MNYKEFIKEVLFASSLVILMSVIFVVYTIDIYIFLHTNISQHVSFMPFFAVTLTVGMIISTLFFLNGLIHTCEGDEYE